MEKDDTNTPPAAADIDPHFQAATPGLKQPQRSLEVDVSRFQSALDNSGFSEAEKAEYLHAFWSVILQFVDLGFGIHPANVIASNTCAERPETSSANVIDDKNVKSQTETTKTLIKAADERAAEREEA